MPVNMFFRYKKHRELHFEEVACDDWAIDGAGLLEQLLPQNVFRGVWLVILLVVLVIFGRITFLEINKGAFYRARAIANVNRQMIIPASRGIITDRFNKPLVRNIPTFSVVINITALFKEPDRIITDLKRISKVLNKSFLEIKKIIQRVNLEKSGEIVIARDISLKQVINLRGLQIDSLQIKDDQRREYIDGKIFAHVLGYTGIADEGNAIVGKSGLEAVYDNELRGVDGKYIIRRDAQGDALSKKTIKKSRSGYQLNTTIDADFQRYFYQRFKQGLKSLHRHSGVGLAINPQTGEVLALISLPSFDNNNPARYLKAKHQPLFNRAVSGVYSPGSTIKPLMALAALNENIIIPTDSFYSPGYLEIPNPYHPEHPSRFLDWKKHGWVDLYSALARSSNVYFYIIGGGFGDTVGLGIKRIKKYWDKFLLGQRTGIDLTAENKGFLYGPKEKKDKLGEEWRVGDTYNVSIGQGNLAVTPIRLLTDIAFIATGGKAYKPFIAKNVIDERNNIVLLNEPQKILNHPEWFPYIYEIKKGLRDAVAKPYGTANMLYDLPVTTSAKTGSVQISNNTKTNAFFVGYGPSETPKIAILILVEEALKGSINTLPIAHDVLSWYYKHRYIKMKNEK